MVMVIIIAFIMEILFLVVPKAIMEIQMLPLIFGNADCEKKLFEYENKKTTPFVAFDYKLNFLR